MIRSMTGFGRSEVSNQLNQSIVVEVKSVNHRYCDVTLKNPRKFTMFEPKIRNLFKEYANRGKIDLAISYEDLSEKGVKLHYNKEMAREYIEAFKAMEQDFGISSEVSARELSKCPEVLTIQEENMDEDQWWGLIEQAICEAGERFVASREVEGERLKDDLLQKLQQMKEDVAFVETRSPEILDEYREKLEEKVKDLLETSGIDENRIAAEVTMYADKISVDEEIVRLQSHIEEMENILGENESVGRKLDFMAQEMNREANTILSKSNDVELSNHAINLKTNVEKIREQVQNIE